MTMIFSDHNKQRLKWCIFAAILIASAFLTQNGDEFNRTLSINSLPRPFLRTSKDRAPTLLDVKNTTTTIRDSNNSTTSNPQPPSQEPQTHAEGNETWALIRNAITNEEWIIKRRPLEEYLKKWSDIVDQKYRAADPTNQLDIFHGIGTYKEFGIRIVCL